MSAAPTYIYLVDSAAQPWALGVLDNGTLQAYQSSIPTPLVQSIPMLVDSNGAFWIVGILTNGTLFANPSSGPLPSPN